MTYYDGERHYYLPMARAFSRPYTQKRVLLNLVRATEIINKQHIISQDINDCDQGRRPVVLTNS